ncbi:MAG: SGNH/GDSL hydrolase family protein [Flavobacteriales bacterium]|nr:SGNH/GDSL hydrolase family protein [Flavobacteriales bacterium]
MFANYLTIIGLCIASSFCMAQESVLRILTLGDSYTIGESVPSEKNWPNQLVETLREKGIASKVDIIATTGWRTDDLIKAIKAFPKDGGYDKVSILIGVNNQYQGKAFIQFEQALDTIIALALERCGNDTTALFFVSIPDYAYSPFGSKLERQKISDELDAYNAYMAAKARQLKVPFVDITPSSRTSEAQMFASDGLHPSADQYAAWVKLILEQVVFKKS